MCMTKTIQWPVQRTEVGMLAYNILSKKVFLWPCQGHAVLKHTSNMCISSMLPHGIMCSHWLLWLCRVVSSFHHPGVLTYTGLCQWGSSAAKFLLKHVGGEEWKWQSHSFISFLMKQISQQGARQGSKLNPPKEREKWRDCGPLNHNFFSRLLWW